MIYALGFDINILTLFAMILAIGLVVDDAIIVVERVQYLMVYEKMDSSQRRDQGDAADRQRHHCHHFLFCCRFLLPVGLMAGITGKIYQQLAVTIATSIAFSAFNALDASAPSLCAIFCAATSRNSRAVFSETV